MLEHLPPSISGMRRSPPAHESEPDTPRENLDEKMRILQALLAHAGNQTRAAASIPMPLRTFIYKLDKYGIERPRKKRDGYEVGAEDKNDRGHS